MVIFSYTYCYDKVKSVSVGGPTQLATKYGELKSNTLSVLVGVLFYFYIYSQCYVFFHYELLTQVNNSEPSSQYTTNHSVSFRFTGLAFSSLTMSVGVGLRWASGSPSTNFSELFVHCQYFRSQIPAQHQTHLILFQSCLWGWSLMHALYDEVDCLNHRVVTMVADKLKRQYFRGLSFVYWQF